jgi:ABC-type antimicrobial peptide transport system permease subunit
VPDEPTSGVSSASSTFYQPLEQLDYGGGRLFVRTALDPHALVPAITRAIREIDPEQPVERAATLEEVRAEQLSPERVNALVFSGFAGIALLIAEVGIAGVLAFSVSARMREFGMRLAVGCTPQGLLTHVLSQGTAIAGIGIAAGAIGGFTLSRVAASFTPVQLPGALAVIAAAALLFAAAVAASWLPAARASRIDIVEALRAE